MAPFSFNGRLSAFEEAVARSARGRRCIKTAPKFGIFILKRLDGYQQAIKCPNNGFDSLIFWKLDLARSTHIFEFQLV